MLVRDVDAVYLNAGRTTETAAKRDRRIPVLETKTKTGGVLNLDARLQLCQIQEVAAVDWQVLNLLLIQDTLHRGLLRVHPRDGVCYLDNRLLWSDRQSDIHGRRVAYKYSQSHGYGAEAFGRDLRFVI